MLALGSHVMIDARDAVSFAEGHLPMALSLPEVDFETAVVDLAPFLTPEIPVLVYCGGLDCDAALRVALLLKESGLPDVTLFAEGFARWQAEGRPVE